MRYASQITLKQLRALRAVATENTISAAALQLGLTGPAVHSQLKSLEEIVGCSLLSREGSDRNAATPQGQALLDAYAEITASLDRAVHQIVALNQGRSGRVVLGVVSTGKYFAPKIVAMLQREMPGIEVSLVIGNRGETIEDLKRGAFDLCIMGRPPREPLTQEVTLADHPHVLIAAHDHPLAGLPHVPRDAVLKERFVMREAGSGTRILASRFLDEIGDGQEVARVVMDSNETIKQAVMSGMGVAVISAHTVADELRTGRLVCLHVDGLPISRKWYLLSRPDRPLSAAAETVRDWIGQNTDRIFPDLKGLCPSLG